LRAFEKHLNAPFSIFAANLGSMRKLGWLFFFFLAVMGSQSLLAQHAEDPCKGEENQTNLNLCAQQNYQKADAELNATWKKLLEHLTYDEIDQLREVQRIWLKFRDAECAFEVAPFDGGSIVPMIQYGCLQRLTEERTRHLKDLLSAHDN
jgi:uncharacterized protein YecT (DUF1311 family)